MIAERIYTDGREPIALNRVIWCRVPQAVLHIIGKGTAMNKEIAITALQTGLTFPVSERAPQMVYSRLHQIVLPCPGNIYDQVVRLGEEFFDGDTSLAASWLMTVGSGVNPHEAPQPQSIVRPFLKKAESPEPPVHAVHPLIHPATRPATKLITRSKQQPREQPARHKERVVPSNAGEILRERRVSLGKSQSELARESGISRSFIAEVESGRRNPGAMSWGLVNATLTLLEQNRLVSQQS